MNTMTNTFDNEKNDNISYNYVFEKQMNKLFNEGFILEEYYFLQPSVTGDGSDWISEPMDYEVSHNDMDVIYDSLQPLERVFETSNNFESLEVEEMEVEEEIQQIEEEHVEKSRRMIKRKRQSFNDLIVWFKKHDFLKPCYKKHEFIRVNRKIKEVVQFDRIADLEKAIRQSRFLKLKIRNFLHFIHVGYKALQVQQRDIPKWKPIMYLDQNRNLILDNGMHFSSTTQMKEVYDYFVKHPYQSDIIAGTSWATAQLQKLVGERIRDSILSSWPGITITTGMISGIVSSVLSIVFQSVDLYQRGITPVSIISFICSLISMVSHIATSLGLVSLFQNLTGFTDALTSIFSTVSESGTINDFVEATGEVNKNQFVEAFSTLTPLEGLNANSNYVETSCSKEFIEGYAPSNGACGYFTMLQFIKESHDVAWLRSELLKFYLAQKEIDTEVVKVLQIPFGQNFSLSQEGWVTNQIFEIFALRFKRNLCFHHLPNNNRCSRFVADDKYPWAHVKFHNNHWSPLIDKQFQAAPSLETFISLGCGMAAFALSVCGMSGIGWATELSKSLILDSKLRDTLKKNVKDTRELVESLAEDCFGVQMSKHAKLKEDIIKVNDLLSSYLQNSHSHYVSCPEDYFKFRDVIQRAESIYTSINIKANQLPISVTNALTLLVSDLTRAKQLFIELGRATQSGRKRIEPLFLHLVGRHGAGKTYFTLNYLIPEVIKHFGFDENTYALNFGGQVYFPPYGGQPIIFYDEFLALNDDDPVIPHINGICGTGYYNMPGADLWTKTQECLARLLIGVSNKSYVSLKKKMSPEAEHAFYSRPIRYEIINRNIPQHENYIRDTVKHTKDFSEFEIRKYYLPANECTPHCAMSTTKEGLDTENLKDPYVIINKEDMLKEIIHLMEVKAAVHKQETLPLPPASIVPQLSSRFVPIFKSPGSNPAESFASIMRNNNRNRQLRVEYDAQFKLFLDDLKFYKQDLKDNGDESEEASDWLKGSLEYDYSHFTNEQQKQIEAEFKLIYDTYRSLNLETKRSDELKHQFAFQSLSTGQKVDHFVLLLTGQTDTGKSTAATEIGLELSLLFKLPLINVTTQQLRKVTATQPSVVVLHDKCNNEQDFIEFYDTLPKPSIIINTCNLRFDTKFGYYPCKEIGLDWDENQGFISNCVNRTVGKLTDNLSALRKVITLKPHSAAISEPGFGRRVGVPGYLWHANDLHFRSFETTEYYEVSKYARMFDPIKKEERLVQNVLERCVNKYNKLIAQSNGLEFIHVEDLQWRSADVELRFETLEEAKSYVNNPVKIMSLYSKFASGKNIGSFPELSISQRVVGSSFLFAPQMFRIGDIDDIESVKEMANRAFTLLKKGSSEFTCSLSFGNDFLAVCKGNVIEWRISGKVNAKVMILDHQKQLLEHSGKQLVRYNITGTQSGETKVLCTLNGEQIVKALLFGVQEISEVQDIKIYKYIVHNKDMFEKDADLFPYFIKYRPRKIFLKEKLDEAQRFYTMWNTFLQSSLFTIIKILLALALAIIGIFALIKMGKIIYNIFKQPGKEVKGSTTKVKIWFGNQIVDLIITEREKDIVAEIEICSEDVVEELNDIVEEAIRAEITDQSKPITNIRLNLKQSDIKEQKKLGKAGKGLNRKPIRKIEPMTEATLTRTTTAIIDKAYKAGVWVEGSRSNCYGIRWKNLDVITPAHIWSRNGDIGKVMVPIGEDLRTTTCLVYWVDHDNDIAVCRLRDKTINNSPDLTKYFVKEYKMENHQEGLLIMRNTDRLTRPLKFHQTHPMLVSGTIDILRQNANEVGRSMKRQFQYNRVQYLEMPTQEGDCGLPYVVADRDANHEIIIGLHTNIAPSHRTSFGNLISQEYLAEVTLGMVGTEYQSTAYTSLDNLGDITEDLKELHPRKPDYGVKTYVDKYYDAWWSDLYQYEPSEEEDIFYDAEDKPENNIALIGYDKKFSPSWIGKPSHVETPWCGYLEEVESLPKKKWLSVTKATQLDKELADALPKIKGRPNVLLNQVNMYNDERKTSPEMLPLLEQAKEMLLSQYRQFYKGTYRILSDLEVINGTIFTRDEIYGELEAMDLDTSSGDYPARKYGITTKKPLFEKININSKTGADVYDWGQSVASFDVRKRVYQTEVYAIEGVRVFSPCKDAVKREIVEKRNKSRLFTVMSMELTCLIRKYSGAFQAIVKKNRDAAHCQVGINVLPGFNQLYNRLLKVSKYGEAGDFSRWDKHLLAVLVSTSVDIIKQLYLENSPERDHHIFENVFNVIKENIVNSISICDGVVYMKIIGNPSGQGLTTITNGIVNDLQVLMNLIWSTQNHNKFIQSIPTDDEIIQNYGMEFHNLLGIMREEVQFDLKWVEENVDWVNYGDDLFKAVNPKYLWLLNFETAKKFYWEILGITYDTPEKDGGMYKYSKLEELSFISRNFRREAGLIFPALKKSSIESLLHWARKNTKEQWADNIKICLDEGSLWGEEYYKFLTDKILKITDFCHKKRISISVTIPNYAHMLANNISKIRDVKKSVEILPMEPQTKVMINIEKSTDDKLTEQFYKMLAESTQQGIESDSLTLCKRVHDTLTQVKFFGNELCGYRAFPAIVYRKNNIKQMSICFEGVTCSIRKAAIVQSDIDKNVLVGLKPLGLTLQDITICYRSLDGGKSLIPIWQTLFNLKIKREGPDFSIRPPITTQATGTQTRNPIQGGDNQTPDGETTFYASGGDIVPKRDINRVLWHRDICEVAHTPMETPDSPIIVNMETQAHTVIFKRELNNTSKMPPGMATWANMHKYSNATRVISVKFVSAATLVNELVCGISPVSKTTYTIQELQLIKWVALNPQDVTATIPLELSDVAWTGLSNGEVNRYEFRTGDEGTDASPINIPTFVMMTRVGIQNSYDNTKLTIQLAVTEHFKPGGKFLIDQDILNSYLPKTIYGYRQTTGETLSSWLNMEPGRPLYITCDGQFLGTYPSTRALIPGGTKLDCHSTFITGKNDDDEVIFTIGYSDSGVISIPVWSTTGTTFQDNIVYQTDPDDLVMDGNMSQFVVPYILHMFSLTQEIPEIKSDIVAFSSEEQEEFPTIMSCLQKVFDPEDLIIRALPQGSQCISYEGTHQRDYFSVNDGTGTITTYFNIRPKGDVESVVNDVKYYIDVTIRGKHYTFLCYLDTTFSDDITNMQFNMKSQVYSTPDSNTLWINKFKWTVPDQIPSSALFINRTDTLTLDSNFSMVSFPSTIPTTLSKELAETRVPTEWNDFTFVEAFKRKLKSAGITYNTTQDLVLFNISTILNGGIAIVVAYNPQYDAFFIANSPKTDDDCYKIFRKLHYEDVVFSQPRVINKLAGNIPITVTSGWISRVSEDKTFDGVNMISRKVIKARVFDKQPRSTYQAAAAGIIAGAGIITSVFQELGGFLIQSSLMDKQMKIALQEMQQKYQNQMNLIDEQNKATLQQLDKKYELELRNATAINQQKFEQQNQLKGLYSAMPWVTNKSTTSEAAAGPGDSIVSDVSKGIYDNMNNNPTVSDANSSATPEEIPANDQSPGSGPQSGAAVTGQVPVKTTTELDTDTLDDKTDDFGKTSIQQPHFTVKTPKTANSVLIDDINQKSKLSGESDDGFGATGKSLSKYNVPKAINTPLVKQVQNLDLDSGRTFNSAGKSQPLPMEFTRKSRFVAPRNWKIFSSSFK